MYKFQLKEPLPTKYTTKNIFLMFPLIFYYFDRTSVDVHNILKTNIVEKQSFVQNYYYGKSLVTITPHVSLLLFSIYADIDINQSLKMI